MQSELPAKGSSKLQLRLIDLLGLFVVFGAVCTIAAAGPAIWRSVTVQQAEVISLPQWISFALSWCALLAFYVRRRAWWFLAANVGIPGFFLAAAFDPRADDFPFRVSVLLGIAWLCAVISFCSFLQRRSAALIERHASVTAYLAFSVLCGAISTSALCGLPMSLVSRSFHAASFVFGALMGVWFGLHHTVTASRRIAALRPFGPEAHAAITAGFYGAMGFSFCFLYLELSAAGSAPFVTRFSPLLSLLTAAPAALIAHRRRRQHDAGNGESGET